MNTEPDDKPLSIQDWRTLAIQSLVRSGPSFVLLLLVLAGLGRITDYVVHEGIPAHLDRIQAGYLHIEQAHTRQIESVVAAVEAERATLRETHVLLVEAVDRLSREPAARQDK